MTRQHTSIADGRSSTRDDAKVMCSLTRGERTWGVARGRRCRGVGFLFFTLITLPVAMFSLALGVDFTRVFLGARQVSMAAQEAALAGAFQTQGGRSVLNVAAAEEAAHETFTRAGAAGVYHLSEANATATATTRKVTVDVDYEISGLVFMGWFAEERTWTGRVQRSATVCVPATSSGVSEPGDPGLCTRPE